MPPQSKQQNDPHNLPPRERRCQATTKNGNQCKGWAVDGDFCAVHSGRVRALGGAPEGNENALKHGFYADGFTQGELARLVAYADSLSLDDEIGAARVLNGRLLRFLLENADDLASDELGSLMTVQARGLKLVAELVRAKHALEGKAGDGIAGAIAMALDEIGNQWGVDL